MTDAGKLIVALREDDNLTDVLNARGRDNATAFQREVVRRFGLVPNFFCSAPDAPEIVEKLWEFANSAYFDNPIPSIFKERLFVYLSRFCEVRYCIVRHCAFLLGYGHAAGDPSAEPQTVEQAIRLLKSSTPWQRDSEALLNSLELAPAGAEWPAPESDFEDCLFSATALVFVEPRRAGRAQRALRHALGGRQFEHLLGLLAFIRTAHYWTVLHPELTMEEDVCELLGAHEELARLLLHDPEAARCEMDTRLFAELEDLRGLNERRELEKANRALEMQVEQKELLLKEANHRIKNSLQIVASILHLQISHCENAGAVAAMRGAASRVLAIAALHERLYTGTDIRIVSLDAFLRSLCEEVGRAFDCAAAFQIDLDVIDVPTDMAVPVGLVLFELVSNAVKHGAPPYKIAMQRVSADTLMLRVSDAGQGPSNDESRAGMGSRIMQAIAKQLGAQIATHRQHGSYTVETTIPVR